MDQFLKPLLLLTLAFLTLLTSTGSKLQAGEIIEQLPVSIKSPVSGKTFAFCQIKSRLLDRDAKKNMLLAHVHTNQGKVSVILKAIQPEDVARYSKEGGDGNDNKFSLQSLFQ